MLITARTVSSDHYIIHQQSIKMSGGNSLILHLLVITPVCQYLLTSPKFPKPRNILFAIAFLFAVAMAGEMYEWQSRPANLYSVLEVDRSATAAELKRAYRDATLKYHPDKNKSPDAPVCCFVCRLCSCCFCILACISTAVTTYSLVQMLTIMCDELNCDCFRV